MRSEEYCARVLNKICPAAIDDYGNGDGGGLLVNYRDLPGAMATKFCPISASRLANASARP